MGDGLEAYRGDLGNGCRNERLGKFQQRQEAGEESEFEVPEGARGAELKWVVQYRGV